jgi:predicted permease
MPAMRDLRYALRQLLGSPGYTLVAVLTLALGMGATTAFFSVLYGVVLRTLPYPDAGRLASLVSTRPETDDDGERLSRAEIADIAARQRAFTAIGAMSLGRMTLNASGDGSGFAERIKVADVSPEVFPILGITAARGRTFTAADVGAGRVAVISDGLWRERYAAAADLTGRTIRLNGDTYAVVGVMPPGFAYPETEMGAWLPLDLRPPDAADRENRDLFTVARLADGVSLAQARDDLARVAADLQRAQPADYPADRWTLGAASLRDRQYGHMRLPLVVLFVAAASVLLIACVNVAIMALLRAVARRREISIRLAIGASRSAIVRQLLVEAAVLATCGAIGGALAARVGLDLLIAGAPADVPRLDQIALDLPALLFVSGVLVLVTLVVGLAPSLVPAALRGGDGLIASRRASDSRATARLRDGLTIAEVALAAALMVCAGFTLRTLQGLLQVDLGFATANRVSFKTNLTAQAYPDAPRVEAFYRQLLERMHGVAGVERVAAISYAPMSSEGQVQVVAPETPIGSPARTPVVRWSVVRGPYFETMGIALLRGRVFDDAVDRAEAPLTAIVDDTLARRWWQREEAAIGQRVRVGEGTEATVREIVGVVRHVAHGGPSDLTFPMIYVPQAQVYQRGMYTVVESRLPANDVLAAARQALAAIDPAVPLYFAQTQEARYDSRVALPRFVAGLVGAFSALALLLAGVGIFGVTAYAVSQRTREFGIRIALGAQRPHIRALVLGRVAMLVGAGLAVGGALALGLGRLIGGLLFRVEPDDPIAFAIAAGALAATAVLAAVAPMRAAVRVDPAVTLKAE